MSREKSPPHQQYNMNQAGAVSPQGFSREIIFEDINFGEVVGRGAFGVVNKAVWNEMQVAVKTMEGEDAAKTLNKEFHQLSRLRHENIIRLFGVCSRKPKVCLIMEYAEDGSLYDVLHPSSQDIQPCVYTIGHVMSWALQCAKAMAYLHGFKPTPIVHRDLKPPNMLLKERGLVLKICDFGTARPHDTSHMTSNKGSAAWMAPEVFEGPVYSEKCDIFSFSIVLWEMITRRKPFEDIGPPPFRIMWAVHSGRRPPLIRGIPKIFEHLIICAWSKDAQTRPPFSAIVQFLEKASKYVTGGNIPLVIVQTTTGRDSESCSSYETQNSPLSRTVISVPEEGRELSNQEATPTVVSKQPLSPLIAQDPQVTMMQSDKMEENAQLFATEENKEQKPPLTVESHNVFDKELTNVQLENIQHLRTPAAPNIGHQQLKHEPVGPPPAGLYPMHPNAQEFLPPPRNERDRFHMYDHNPGARPNYVHRTPNDDCDYKSNYPPIDRYRFPYWESGREWFDNQHYQEGAARFPPPGELPHSNYPFTATNQSMYGFAPHNDENVTPQEKQYPRLSPRPPYQQVMEPGTPMPYSAGPRSASPQNFYMQPMHNWNNLLVSSTIPEHSPVDDLTAPISRLELAPSDKHPGQSDSHGHQFIPITPGSGSTKSIPSTNTSPMTSPFSHSGDPVPVPIRNLSAPTTQYEKKLWHLIDPEIMPVRPIVNNQDSISIYEQHSKLFNDYIDLQNELNYLFQRKRDLQQQLENEKTEQQRSSVYLEDYLKLLEEKLNWSDYLNTVKEELKMASNARRLHENVL